VTEELFVLLKEEEAPEEDQIYFMPLEMIEDGQLDKLLENAKDKLFSVANYIGVEELITNS